jgi:aminoglycoside phosphotransferase (APT) family kinase protein
LARGTAPALELCKALLRLESDYQRRFEAAVRAQSAAAANRTAATARNARDYDAQALQRFIRSVFPEEPDVTIGHSGFISGGYSKFTVEVTLQHARSLPAQIILRADASATFGGASVVQEYHLLKVMHAQGVRVPRPLAVEETGQVFGSPFMLVERKPGISIGHMYKLPQPDKAVCRDVAGQLAAIHRIPVAAFGDRIGPARGRSSEKALAWIAEGLAAWTPLHMPSPVFETAFEWLRRNAALNDEAPRTLVHGDVHLANMLVHEHRISTILDWEFAHIGNPAYDLGYFYDQAVALDSWEAFLDAYREAGGAVPDQRQLDYHILFAATRLGVMTCQSVAEFASGAKPGLAGAVVIGGFFYETTIVRIARALERVLAQGTP